MRRTACCGRALRLSYVALGEVPKWPYRHRLEIGWGYRPRGFESHPLRQSCIHTRPNKSANQLILVDNKTKLRLVWRGNVQLHPAIDRGKNRGSSYHGLKSYHGQ